MKKIGIDIRCLMDGRRTGVEEYTQNVLENLFSIDKENKYFLFVNSWSQPKFNLKFFKKYPNVKIIFTRVPNKLLNFCFWYFSWPKIDQILGGVDILWLPNISFVAVSKKVKLILTIHDLSFECNPQYFSLKRRLWHIFINPKKICQRANKIIAVSKSTGKDITNIYKINSKKIRVIHSACSDKFKVINRNDERLLKVKEKHHLPYLFILCLGTLEPRKNIVAVIRAFEQLKIEAKKENNIELTKYGLVIAGEKGWKNEKIFEEIENSPFKDKIKVIMPVLELDKEYIYNLASVFVFPSFFEGFGLPPLEAMSSGVPVIASNNSSLSEVIGEAGILIDPDKPSEIYQAVKEIILDQNLREKLKKKGLEKATKFHWEETARNVLSLFS
jgi:glycosyltransferase involved in cell wall biosynthesis